jgi:hypothetical protein
LPEDGPGLVGVGGDELDTGEYLAMHSSERFAVDRNGFIGD